ncbi:hypothetical protein pb186bvf_005682 [Paramecium bursaria]
MQSPEFFALSLRLVQHLFQKSHITNSEKSLIKDLIFDHDSELHKQLFSEFQTKQPSYRLLECLRNFIRIQRLKTEPNDLRKHSTSTDLTSLESIWEIDDEEQDEEIIRPRR